MLRKFITSLLKRRYLIAILLVGTVTGFRYILGSILGNEAPLLFFLLAVTASALLGGMGPGLLATVMGAFAGAFFFMEPIFSFIIHKPVDQAHIAAFLLEGFAVSWLCAQLLKTKKSALRSEENFRTIFENAAVGIAQVEPQSGKFIVANKKMSELTGYSNEELLNMGPSDLTHPDYRAIDDLKMKLLREGKEKFYSMDKRYVRKDGRVIWVRVNANAVVDQDGKLARLAGIVQDITSEKLAEQEIIQAKEAAERATEAKSRFLANMSHEIRTPLGAVMGFSELLADSVIAEEERSNYSAAVKRNGELLSNIINDILDLTKVEAGKIDINFREVALEEIMADTRPVLELLAKEKGVDLRASVDNDVPRIIRTDPLRLRQILINVVGNAIKFTDKGFVEILVKLVNSKMAFVVRDTGPGISQTQMDKLFTPFSQVDMTSKRKFGGTGLGLILSKRLAGLLGGDLELMSTVLGKGSTFMVTIDPGRLVSAPRREGIKEKGMVPQSKDQRLNGLKVLLAEDGVDNQILIGQILKLVGATVDVANNGLEAVERANQGQYDVVLMDLQMPVMDGYEATAELRKQGYKGKIIALTAHALSDVKQRCLEKGFDNHISKPISRKVLIHELSELSH